MTQRAQKNVMHLTSHLVRERRGRIHRRFRRRSKKDAKGREIQSFGSWKERRRKGRGLLFRFVGPKESKVLEGGKKGKKKPSSFTLFCSGEARERLVKKRTLDFHKQVPKKKEIPLCPP